MGFSGFSSRFVTGCVTIVGCAVRTPFGRGGTGSDVGRTGCAASSAAALPGARPVVGRTSRTGAVMGRTAAGIGSGTRRAGRAGSSGGAFLGSASGCGFMGSACCGPRPAGDASSLRPRGTRLGCPTRCGLRRAADRRPFMGGPRLAGRQAAGATMERARPGVGHTEDRRARRAARTVVVGTSDQVR